MSNFNPLSNLGTQYQSSNKTQQPIVSEKPLYTSNKIAVDVAMGEVAVAAIINGTEAQYIAKRLFPDEKNDADIPNVASALVDILEALKDDPSIQEGKTVIGIPTKVMNIVNNISLLTRMSWTGLDLKHKDKSGNIRTMAKAERAMYTKLLGLICECAPYICFMDTRYTHRKMSTAYNDEQKEWCKVNSITNKMLKSVDLSDDEIDERYGVQ